MAMDPSLSGNISELHSDDRYSLPQAHHSMFVAFNNSSSASLSCFCCHQRKCPMKAWLLQDVASNTAKDAIDKALAELGMLSGVTPAAQDFAAEKIQKATAQLCDGVRQNLRITNTRVKTCQIGFKIGSETSLETGFLDLAQCSLNLPPPLANTFKSPGCARALRNHNAKNMRSYYGTTLPGSGFFRPHQRLANYSISSRSQLRRLAGASIAPNEKTTTELDN